MEKLCLRGRVRGKVQGVLFRAETRRRALELKLDGWVRNRSDGSVEVMICGVPSEVEAMRAWLANGPPMARVDSVELEPVAEVPLPGFHISG